MKLSPVSRPDLIRRLRSLGWSGPFYGTKHQHMAKGVARSGSTRANQIIAGLECWEAQATLECEINPVGQSGLQLGERFLSGFTGCKKSSETGDTGHKPFLFAKESDLSEFQSLATVCFQHLHSETIVRTKG